jgi:hypothetical protein
LGELAIKTSHSQEDWSGICIDGRRNMMVYNKRREEVAEKGKEMFEREKANSKNNDMITVYVRGRYIPQVNVQLDQ